MTETPSTPPVPDAPKNREGEAPSRGDATREALLDAALELFGRRGYHATGNRALAATAGVNPALIGYHFGGKRGLYLATFQTIAERMQRRLGPAARSIEAELNGAGATGDRAAETLLPLLHRLLDAFVAMMAAEESGPWARLIVREQMDPSEALDILYDGVLGRVLALVTRLVHEIGGAGDASEAPTPGATGETGARLTALTLMGQALIFRVARATALRHLEWEEIGPEELALIQQRVRDNGTALLNTSRIEPGSKEIAR